MKSLLLILATWTLNSNVMAAESCPSGWVCPATPIYTSTIGAWYHMYWMKPDHPISHWKEWTRYKPVQGYYSAGDPHTNSAHITAMKEAGIEFIIFDHTNGIGNDAGTIEANAQSFMTTNSQLPASSQLKISVALGYQLYFNKSVEAHKGEADHVFSKYVSNPNHFKIDGKPLLVIYNSIESATDCFACTWTDPRFTIRRAGGLVDGSNPVLQKYKNEGVWGWAMKSPLLESPEAITVMPGWHTRHLKRDTTPIDRANGEYYMNQWLVAIKNNPRHIVVASWNDWAEENFIEPGVAVTGPKFTDSYGTEVPDYYLQITAAYGNLKKGLMPGFYYKDEDDATVYVVTDGKLVAQNAMPRGKAVTKLPSGTIKKILGTSSAPGAPANPSGPSEGSNEKISAGLFKVGATIGYSNGTTFCLFDNMNNYTKLTGKKDADGVPDFPNLPRGMKNDGFCIGK